MCILTICPLLLALVFWWLLLALAALFQPAFDRALFAKRRWLIIAPPFEVVGQIFLKSLWRRARRVVDGHLRVDIVAVDVAFAIVQVFHQLRGGVANPERNRVVACLLHILLDAPVREIGRASCRE